MIENLALIKEVHLSMPTKKAQEIAMYYLQKIELSHIGNYRVNQCQAIEIFYIMLIRALMNDNKNIMIKIPYTIIESLRDIKSIFTKIDKLNEDKNIFILDLLNNKIHYEGYPCNIIK